MVLYEIYREDGGNGITFVVVSNTYCVMFLLCFSSSCVPYVASFSGLSIFDCPSCILTFIWDLSWLPVLIQICVLGRGWVMTKSLLVVQKWPVSHRGIGRYLEPFKLACSVHEATLVVLSNVDVRICIRGFSRVRNISHDVNHLCSWGDSG